MQRTRGFVWAALVLELACGRRSGPAQPQASALPETKASAIAPPVPRDRTLREPTVLLTLPISAYAPWLVVDEEVVYLLTTQAAYRLVPGKEPAQIQLGLGIGPTLTNSSLIYWSKGAIWRAPKTGGKAERVARLSHEPQRFVTSGEKFAWLDRTDEGKFTIQTLERGKPRTIWSASGDIDTLTMLEDWVFFVEREASSSWRFGAVRVAGGEPTFSAPKSGRTPAMLAPHEDIYFYDSNTLEIHRLSPDFSTDQVVSEKFICSPLAVSTRIYCAHMAGLFELSPGSSPIQLTASREITAVAASATLVAWIRDAGPDHLAVEMLPVRDGR
jgi:hypothetical protein